ncbi:thioesterase family protein [Rurimicrobium arvi]|uniref:Thioesterase family protein n=1 Tax=Rurimicrobium arvi TaxID=2049916 RepID=A0ABP8MW67_9BACT
MYEYSTQIRVRYGETDQMGYLYYGNYALYYEVGRTDAIRNLGLTYKAMEEAGVALPVAECNLQYLRPAFYDDLLLVKTSIRTLPEDSFIEFHTEIYNEKNKLINKGLTRLVFYDIAAKKKTLIPEILLDKLKPYFHS